MLLSLIVLAALAAKLGEAVYDPYTLGASSLAGNFGLNFGVGGFNTFASHSHFPQMPQKEPNLKITCQNGNANEGLGVTIEEKIANIPALGAFGSNLLGRPGESRLNATIELISQMVTTEPVSIIITEKAFPQSPCDIDDFGAGISPSSKKNAAVSGFGSVAGYNYGAAASALADPYGFSSAFSPVGLGPVGLGPLAVGYGFPAVSFGGHAQQGPTKAVGDGELVRFDLGVNKMQIVRLSSLPNIKDIAELAGRGLVVCSKSDIGFKEKATCLGTVINCCKLGYDSMARSAP